MGCWRNSPVLSAPRAAVWQFSAEWQSAIPACRRKSGSDSAPASIVGDITHDEEDLFGDGVNIVARLEALAGRVTRAIVKNPEHPVRHAGRGDRGRVLCELSPCCWPWVC